MLLSISATADYQLNAETYLVLMVEPRIKGERHQVREESLRTTHTPFAQLSCDIYGNAQRRFIAPKGLFTFDFNAVVDTEAVHAVPEQSALVEPHLLPVEIVPYTLPSRYCPSDRLNRLAFREFGDAEPGAAQVRGIARWVSEHVEYTPGADLLMVPTAEELLIHRYGVCRDIAHVVIALCRTIGVPTRYVSGYCLGLEPPDFHAWAQVYLNGEWYDVDATTRQGRAALVPIAFGRDAADVPLVNFWGQGIMQGQSVQVERVTPQSDFSVA